jgi:hypothetical protein
MAVGIGAAGDVSRGPCRARWLVSDDHALTREEDGRGGYVLASPMPLAEQLRGIDVPGLVAIVDDTIFSGLTLRAVLDALPDTVRRRTHVFCLRAVAASLPAIASVCPVTAGFVAPGRLLNDVSFINASGLVRRGAIRRVGAPPLAFFEPGGCARGSRTYRVTRLCRAVRAARRRGSVFPGDAPYDRGHPGRAAMTISIDRLHRNSAPASPASTSATARRRDVHVDLRNVQRVLGARVPQAGPQRR